MSPNPQNIQTYYEKDSQRMPSESKWAAYFDFSGVYIAYDDPATAQTFNAAGSTRDECRFTSK